MLIDMHIHTNVSSRCSSITPEELVERSCEICLDAVCVTEHSTVRGAEICREYAAKRGFKVFRGMEVYTDRGDMLIFGWDGHVRYYLVSFKEIRTEVEKRGGIIIPAHPFRGISDARHGSRFELPAEVVESIVAIETKNGAIPRHCNDYAEELRKKYNLFGVGGSDAHHVSHIGRCLTFFEADIKSENELVDALRNGCYQALYAEEAISYISETL